MEIINSSNFNEITSKGIVLVDFFANWCGPCKMLAPVLEETANEMKNVTFVKVDVDQEPGLAGKYGIQAIPHMVIFKDGKAVDSITGFVGKDVIVEKLNNL
ncbi:thioredoxin [[Clostridium] spiroforme]|nr:thioredoxin [Thomasclavelia spiroformis]MBM6879911.1 thioredoxin [Thomasclavelia spiroformis]MBM6931298.1 thioredoxin [Thomasclavelia spiroformis]